MPRSRWAKRAWRQDKLEEARRAGGEWVDVDEYASTAGYQTARLLNTPDGLVPGELEFGVRHVEDPVTREDRSILMARLADPQLARRDGAHSESP